MNNLWETLKKYPQIPSFALWRAVELRILQPLINEFKNPILDAGCGDGSFGLLFFKHLKQIDLGIDIDIDMLEMAKTVPIYEKVELINACSMTLKDNSFKTVFSNCVFEHIPCYTDALKEVYRILQPEGRFILTVPSENYHKFLYHYKLYMQMNREDKAREYTKHTDDRHQHYYYMPPEKWKELLKSTGFKDIEINYYLPEETLSKWDRIEEFYTRELFTMLRSYKMRALSLTPSFILRIIWYFYLNHYYKAEVMPGHKGGALLIKCTK